MRLLLAASLLAAPAYAFQAGPSPMMERPLLPLPPGEGRGEGAGKRSRPPQETAILLAQQPAPVQPSPLTPPLPEQEALAKRPVADSATQEAWEGAYDCPQGRTGLTLTLEPADTGITALFHFYADPSNPGVPEGCFAMSGTLDPATGRLELHAGQWLLRPNAYVTVDMTGRLSPDRQRLQGEIPSPGCTVFNLRRTIRPAHAPPPPCRPGSALVS